MGNTCTPMADSRQYMAKTTIILKKSLKKHRWGWWGEAQKEELYVYLWLIHTVVQQKATQHCKAIILQSKLNF